MSIGSGFTVESTEGAAVVATVAEEDAKTAATGFMFNNLAADEIEFSIGLILAIFISIRELQQS